MNAPNTTQSAIIILLLCGWFITSLSMQLRKNSRNKMSRLACCTGNTNIRYVENSAGGLEQTEANYGAAIDQLATQFNLSPAYLKALITLECSGRKEFTPRFEPHVCNKLKRVRNSIISRFENISPEVIHDATDGAIQNLSTSWGPFQIMGYKCISLGINVQDLRGDSALYWGIKWIDMTYGDYVRGGRYKDAFHIHNAGVEYPSNGKPQTHDPEYVNKGLSYMSYFNEKSEALHADL